MLYICVNIYCYIQDTENEELMRSLYVYVREREFIVKTVTDSIPCIFNRKK